MSEWAELGEYEHELIGWWDGGTLMGLRKGFCGGDEGDDAQDEGREWR